MLLVQGLSELFPFLFGRAFIEASIKHDATVPPEKISLPFRKGFH